MIVVNLSVFIIMDKILSIGITSYKRIKELERCIKSIETKYVDDIEIIVSEDCSPLSREIGEHVETLARQIPYDLKFIPNEHNLGYDRNLGAIIKKSRGEFVFLMSDDDAFYPGFLDVLIPFIKKQENKRYGVIYAPFVYSDTRRKDRNHGKDLVIEATEANAGKYIYDSILFSGLIFKKQYVEGLDAESFLNMNFYQVYMYLKMIYHHGGYYFAKPSVYCVGDGENAYGKSESSGGNAIIADRSSVMSNVEFCRTLIMVIKRFDKEEGSHVFKSFEAQYSFRCYSLLSMARSVSLSFYKDFWKRLNNLDMTLRPIAKVYYYMLLVLGSRISNTLTYYAKRWAKNDEKDI